MKGRTGVGWKWGAVRRQRVAVQDGNSRLLRQRSGNFNQRHQHYQLDTAERGLAEPSSISFGLGCKYCSIPGSCWPASSQTTDRKTLLTDVKIRDAAGHKPGVYLGAKYKWDDLLLLSPWVDRTQLYLGVKFER